MYVNNYKKTDHLGRYFTNESVGKLLIDSMQNVSPSLVLDLGAGDGALTEAASKQWASARFMTVDIDSDARSRTLSMLHGDSFTHTITDALCHDLPQKLNMSVSSADAGVCNPPYAKPKWRDDFKEILDEAGLDDVIFSRKDISAELLFIAQNLRLLKDGGVLGLILPDGIISGENNLSLREKLIKSHAIESIIELPRGVFPRTDAKTHIVVLRKNAASRSTLVLQRINSSYAFSSPIEIDAEKGILRLDYSYHADFKEKNNGVRVGDIATKVIRGRTSSSERRLRHYPVFHISDMFSGVHCVPPEFNIENIDTLPSEICAYSGDILISRVGRNLDDKVCFLDEGKIAISDCITLIRVPELYRDRLFRFLVSDTGKKQLVALSHGVGARFLTHKSIMDLKI